jgi:hypothetical protein
MGADLPADALAVRNLYLRRRGRYRKRGGVIGRIVYFLGHREAGPKRTPSFAIQALSCTVLWIGALGSALWRLVH